MVITIKIVTMITITVTITIKASLYFNDKAIVVLLILRKMYQYEIEYFLIRRSYHYPISIPHYPKWLFTIVTKLRMAYTRIHWVYSILIPILVSCLCYMLVSTGNSVDYSWQRHIFTESEYIYIVWICDKKVKYGIFYQSLYHIHRICDNWVCELYAE